MKERTIWDKITDKINWWIFNALMAGLNSLPHPMEDSHKVLMELFDERWEQVYFHGWTAEHDDKHDRGEIALAAARYATPPEDREDMKWPWDAHWFKADKPRREQLVVAGALIVAEIERLDRVEE